MVVPDAVVGDEKLQLSRNVRHSPNYYVTWLKDYVKETFA